MKDITGKRHEDGVDGEPFDARGKTDRKIGAYNKATMGKFLGLNESNPTWEQVTAGFGSATLETRRAILEKIYLSDVIDFGPGDVDSLDDTPVEIIEDDGMPLEEEELVDMEEDVAAPDTNVVTAATASEVSAESAAAATAIGDTDAGADSNDPFEIFKLK